MPLILLRSLTNNINLKEESMSTTIQQLIDQAKNGQGQAALNGLISFVTENPKDEQAQFLLSSWYFQSMDWENSEKSMVNLLRLAPDNLNYLDNAIGMYSQMSNFKAALKYQERVAELKPDDSGIQYKLGMLYHRLFDFDSALKVFNQLVKKEGEHPQILGLIADIIHGFGRFEEAIEYYHRILKLEPNNEAAINGIVKSTKFKMIDNDLLTKAQRILRDNSVPKQAKAQIYFSLGKMYDDCKEYDNAWSNYRLANEIQSSLYPYNQSALVQQIAQFKEIYNAKFFTDNNWQGNESVAPIFIVGMPRSGTTLLEQVLEHSGMVCAGGESLALNKAINKQFYKIRYPDELGKADSEIFMRLAKDYENYYINCHLSGDMRSIDKLPGNFLHLGLLKKMFPKMKVINLSRNKLDCCLSVYFQMFADHMTFTTDTKNISSFYDTYLETMDYWKTLFPENIFDLSYEDLVSDFETNTKALFEFLELDWNKNVGDFVDSKNSVQTPSSWQVRQGINTKSVGRSKQYESFLKKSI